jgi:hypothetical protein
LLRVAPTASLLRCADQSPEVNARRKQKASGLSDLK